MITQTRSISGSIWWVRLYRIAFALLSIVATAVQLQKSENISNFLSFFTIQSNLIGVVVLLVGGCVVPKESRNWSLFRGAAAIYLMLTGVIYNLLLVDLTESLQTTIPWVNDVLHKVIPIAMLVDLLLIPLARRIRWREATVWVVYPLLYFAYSLIRGAVVDWYPYPFLNPREDGGYLRVAGFSVVVLFCFLACIWIITEVNAWRLRQMKSE